MKNKNQSVKDQQVKAQGTTGNKGASGSTKGTKEAGDKNNAKEGLEQDGSIKNSK